MGTIIGVDHLTRRSRTIQEGAPAEDFAEANRRQAEEQQRALRGEQAPKKEKGKGHG